MIDKTEIVKLMDAKFVQDLVELSGDTNPIHTDDAYAEKSYFKQRVVPAAAVFCLISQGLTKLFGPGNLWVSQTMEMKKPIFLNEQIRLEMKVLSKQNLGMLFEVRTTCFNSKNEIVMNGIAKSAPLYKNL